MIREALQRLAENDSPNPIVARIPDAVWRWAFGVTVDEALMQNAVLELATNPSITVYDFEGGCEFNRRPANPFAALRPALESIADSIANLGDHVTEMMTKIGSGRADRGAE